MQRIRFRFTSRSGRPPFSGRRGVTEATHPTVCPVRITLIDDDADIVGVMHDIFEQGGYRSNANRTTSLRAAQSMVDRERPTLLITDLQFNILDRGSPVGIDLARYVKRRHPTLPIILCTATSMDQLPVADRALFAEIFLKPFDIDRLLQAIQRQLDRVHTKPAYQ